MEIQEIYDTIMKHLRDQNEKAEDNTGCLYHTSDGLKCAVGCLIPDEFYNIDMEGYTLAGLMEDFSNVFEHIKIETKIKFSPQFKLLYDMQCIHDGDIYPNRGWIKEAKIVARKYNLQTNGR